MDIVSQTNNSDMKKQPMYIVRGLPGSGKTVFAESLAKELWDICEELVPPLDRDHFYWDSEKSVGGPYKFNGRLVGDAGYCHVGMVFQQCLLHSNLPCVVEDVFSKYDGNWEGVESFVVMAGKFGRPVVLIRTEMQPTEEDYAKCQRPSGHTLPPPEKMEEIRRHFDDIPGEIVVTDENWNAVLEKLVREYREGNYESDFRKRAEASSNTDNAWSYAYGVDEGSESLVSEVFHGGFFRPPYVLDPVGDAVKLADGDPMTLLKLLSTRKGDFWAEFVARRPYLAEVAPLECLSGTDCAKLLAVRPELADRCGTDKLSGADWRFLLRRRPELASHFGWHDLLSGSDWVALLCGNGRLGFRPGGGEESGADAPRPELAEWCCWGKLSGADWATALSEHPEWASFCNMATNGDGRNGWNRFCGADWAALLAARPQFATVCDWDCLSGADWSALLRERPGFAERCDWGRLGGHDWARLLRKRPEFADKCAWGKIGGGDAVELVNARPELAGHIVWRNLSGRDWHVLTGSHPEYMKHKPADVAIDHTARRPRIFPISTHDAGPTAPNTEEKF